LDHRKSAECAEFIFIYLPLRGRQITTKRNFASIQRKEIREKFCGLCASGETSGEKLKGVSEKWPQNE
jgi:hypothetical protein